MKLAADTAGLLVSSGPRCGDAGLRMYGRHFTAEPQEIALEDLSSGQVAMLLRHPELVIGQLSELSPPAPPAPDPDLEETKPEPQKTKGKKGKKG